MKECLFNMYYITFTLVGNYVCEWNSQGQHISRTKNTNISLWLCTVNHIVHYLGNMTKEGTYMPILEKAHVLKQALTNKNK